MSNDHFAKSLTFKFTRKYFITLLIKILNLICLFCDTFFNCNEEQYPVMASFAISLVGNILKAFHIKRGTFRKNNKEIFQRSEFWDGIINNLYFYAFFF